MSGKRNTKRKSTASPIAFCDEHKCPLIQIGDEYACVYEYTDDLIGGHKVVDAIPGDMTVDPPVAINLVFDNGRSLPLLCPCCGEAIVLDPNATGDQLLERVKDTYLVGLGYDDEQNGLIMLFSYTPEADPNNSEGVLEIVVHFDSIRGIEDRPVSLPGLLDTSI